MPASKAMNPFSMEMMFLILSGVILAAGILYWFWSHIQLTQKKVQLLENAVFELRGMVGRGPDTVVSGTVYRDLDDDDWTEPKVEQKAETVAMTSTPIELLDNNINNVISNEHIPDDLRPGGRLEPIAESNVELVESSVKSPGANEQFRELFINQEAAPTKVETVTIPDQVQGQGQTLEGMPLKELRRLASDRGIAHTSDMRKKELIAALRSTVTKVEEVEEASVTEIENVD